MFALQVKMGDKDTGEELVFYLDRWLAIDQEDGQTCREMPVIRKGTLCLPGTTGRCVNCYKISSFNPYCIDN